MRFAPVRNWTLKRGEKQLFHTYVVENPDGLPTRVQQMRCRAMVNLIHTVNDALADGRVGNRHS
jgi:hypothetical protein